MHELTLPASSPVVGRRVGQVTWPAETALAAIIREDRPITPSQDDTLEAGDELLIVVSADAEPELSALQELLAPAPAPTSPTESGPTAARP